MRHELKVPGFEGQRLEIEAGAFKKRLLLNGVEAPAAGMGKYRLVRNDGREVVTQWTGAFDPAPSIKIDGQTYRTAPPFTWHEIVVVFAPLLLVFMGGALGGLIGGVTASINAQLIRSARPAAVRYGGGLALTFIAAFLYVAVAGALRLAVNGASATP